MRSVSGWIVVIAVLALGAVTAVVFLHRNGSDRSELPAYSAEDFSGGRSEHTSVSFSPDGKTLATAGSAKGSDASVWLWDVAGRRNIAAFTLPNHNHASSVVFSPDGKSLAAVASTGARGKRTVWLLDVTGHRKPASLPDQYDYVGGLAFSADGKTLAVGGGRGRDKGKVWLWDAADRRRIDALPVPFSYVGDVAFSPDRKTLAVGGGHDIEHNRSAGEGIWLWDLARHRNVATLPTRVGVSFMAFSPDGRTLAGDGESNEGEWTDVWLWDLSSRQRTSTITGRTSAHYSPEDEGRQFSSVTFSPDGRTLAVGGRAPHGEGAVLLWDVPGRRNIATVTFTNRRADVDAVAFSPDGRTMAIGGSGLALWQVRGT